MCGARTDGPAISPFTTPEAYPIRPHRERGRHLCSDRKSHVFRATGITAYLGNGGALEHAQSMAAHESPRATKLYDPTRDRLA